MVVLKSMLMLAFFVVWFGFVGPYCISVSFTPLVIGWFALTFFGGAVVIDLLIKKFKIREKLNNLGESK